MVLRQFISKRYFLLSLMFAILSGMGTLVVPVIISSVTDAVQKSDLNLLITGIIFGAVAFSVNQLFSFCFDYYKAKLSQFFLQTAKNAIFQQSFSEKESYDVVQNMMFNDLSLLEENYLQAWNQLIYSLSFSTVSAVYIFMINWELAIIFMVFAIFPIVFPKLFEIQLQRAVDIWSNENKKFIKDFTESFKGISVIKHSRQMSYFFHRLMSQLIRSEKANFDKKLAPVVMNFYLGLTVGVCLLLPFGIGGYFAVQGKLSAGSLLAVFLASDRVIAPLERAMGQWSAIKSTRPILEKVTTFFEDSFELDSSKGAGFAVESLDFVTATIGYDNPLYELTRSLRPNDKVLLTGKSGSGKSTLFKVLFRQHHLLSGQIMINGHLLETIPRADLYSSIGYVPQDVILFDDTIGFNVTLGRDIPQDEVSNVLDKVGLGDKDCHTVVGTDGCLLSGGEKARVILARALVGKYSLILIDEFSASLDREVARSIRQLLFDMDVTIIEIAHHVEESDKVRYSQIWEL
ncbi:ATP-binding cassette domain-containing protein [Streptococcus sp. E17BB]|uniref:ATP-binding cassette domain-containing protein n=1 Tax=Streptococcus sp. E17BB TaxID=3278714 RepID=UPI00359DE5A7